jgi:GGDEF domain-containing protein
VILPDGSEVIPSVSIGSARYPDDGADAEILVRKADESMYLAKSRMRAKPDQALAKGHQSGGRS